MVDDRDICIVEGKTFDSLDDETIDLLSVDVEGSEWFVLERLRSRPRVITLETHGARYRNPYLDEIESWFAVNGYALLYRTSSDSTYVKAGTIRRTAKDQLALAVNVIYLKYRSMAKRMQHLMLDLRRAS